MRTPISTVLLAALLGSTPSAAQMATVSLGPALQVVPGEGYTAVVGIRAVTANAVVIADPVEARLELLDLVTGEGRPIGRVGGGPGEWRLISAVLGAGVGVTFAVDMVQRRLLEIEPEGKVRRTIPLPDGPAVVRGADLRGRVFLEGAASTPTSESPREEVVELELPVLRWDPGTGRMDTLAWVVKHISYRAIGGVSEGLRMGTPPPLAAGDGWVATPDGGVAIVRATPYRVDRVSPQGRLTRGTPLPWDPLPVTPADREAWRAQQRGSKSIMMGGGPLGGGKVPPTNLGQQLAEVPDAAFPATLPPFLPSSQSVQLSADGTVWIERKNPAGNQPLRYDRVAADGRQLPSVTIPRGTRVVGFTANALLLSTVDGASGLVTLSRHAIP